MDVTFNGFFVSYVVIYYDLFNDECFRQCPPFLQNPSQVGVALQVFYNMGQLSTTLVTVLDSYMTAVQADIQNAIDPSFLLQSYSGNAVVRVVSVFFSLSLIPYIYFSLYMYNVPSYICFAFAILCND